MRRYEICGLKDIWLVNGYVEVDTPYGRGVRYVDVVGLHRAIAAAIVDKPGTLAAEELRCLRKELLLSQKALAALIGTTDQALARWERGLTMVPGSADRLVRALYREHADGDPRLRQLVEHLNRGDAVEAVPLRFEHRRRGWKAAA